MAWVAAVEPVIDEVLLDHAWLESRAAGAALGLLPAVSGVEGGPARVAALASEELEHFHRVTSLLHARSVPFRRLSPSSYARSLHAASRPGPVDRLAVCAIIEARSCERMRRLSEGLADAGLRAFYGDLLASEARHFSAYVDLGRQLGDIDEAVERLATHEAALLAAAGFEARLHGGVPA